MMEFSAFIQIEIGATLRITTPSNAMGYYKVTAIHSDGSRSLRSLRRPSRGYARHLRQKKSKP